MDERPVSPGAQLWPAGVRLRLWGPTLWAAAVLAVAFYFFLLTNDIQYAQRPGRLGPVFWPRVILVLLMVTAAFDCLMEARKAMQRGLQLQHPTMASGEKRMLWLMILGLVLTLAYLSLTTLMGFPIANALFMFTFMLLGGFHRPLTASLIAVTGTVSLVVLFVRVVYVSLPLGIGPFQDLTLLLYSLLGIV